MQASDESAMLNNPYSAFEPVSMIKKLEAFFQRRLGVSGGVKISDFHRLQGGYSRLTAAFTANYGSTERQFVIRGDPPFGGTTAVTDRAAEWEVLSVLTSLGNVAVPPACYFDPDGAELGVCAIISERVTGSGLSAASDRYTDADLPEIALQMSDLAASIHGVSVERLPASLRRPASWDAYIDSKIGEIREIERQHVEPDPFYRYIAGWLDGHRPRPAPLTLVHGDFQSANVLYDLDGKLHAIDWEYAHIGDPREDLGWCKAVEVFHIPDLVSLDEEAFCARYRSCSGLADDVVNPRTIAYFMILSSAITLGPVMLALSALQRRQSGEVRSASLVGAIAKAHKLWFETIQAIENGYL